MEATSHVDEGDAKPATAPPRPALEQQQQQEASFAAPDAAAAVPFLVYVEKATTSSMNGLGQEEDDEGEDEDHAPHDDDQLPALHHHHQYASSPVRRPKRRQPVQLLVPEGGRSAGMMLGMPYLTGPPPPPGHRAVAIEPREQPQQQQQQQQQQEGETAADLATRGGREQSPGHASSSNSGLFKEVALMATPADPQEEPADAQAIRRLQILFGLVAILHAVATSTLLFRPEGMDPSLVDLPGAASPHAMPRPFQRPSSEALRAYVPLYGLGLAIVGAGLAAAVAQQALGLRLFGLASFFHLLLTSVFVPYTLYFPLAATSVALMATANRLYAHIVPSWLVVSSDFARRVWMR